MSYAKTASTQGRTSIECWERREEGFDMGEEDTSVWEVVTAMMGVLWKVNQKHNCMKHSRTQSFFLRRGKKIYRKVRTIPLSASVRAALLGST